ncbi:DUF7660 family protein [Streptomyces sp. NBC_00576]|uniref:DUF7660 family protein n=1 Tax=Streptomyces sp. NBC_00576 TaxID=2903665 RepID=UPI003FCD613E
MTTTKSDSDSKTGETSACQYHCGPTTPCRPRGPERLSEASAAGLRSKGDQWENRTLDSFLEALEAWVGDAPGWYANHGQELPADGDWTFMARALSAARFYE